MKKIWVFLLVSAAVWGLGSSAWAQDSGPMTSAEYRFFELGRVWSNDAYWDKDCVEYQRRTDGKWDTLKGQCRPKRRAYGHWHTVGAVNPYNGDWVQTPMYRWRKGYKNPKDYRRMPVQHIKDIQLIQP